MDLRAAGRRHDPSGVHLHDALHRCEGHHRSLVDADRRVAGEDLDPSGRSATSPSSHRTTRSPMDRRGGSGGATRLARADDEQVAAQVSVRARHDRPVGQPSQPHGAPDHPRRHRPRPARTDERLVVEADGGSTCSRSRIASASRSTDGHPRSRRTRIPSVAGVTHERTPGTPSTVTRQLGHSPSRSTGLGAGDT